MQGCTPAKAFEMLHSARFGFGLRGSGRVTVIRACRLANGSIGCAGRADLARPQRPTAS